MRKYTIRLGKIMTAAVAAAGVCILSATARAQDSVPAASPAASVADAGTIRAVVVKSMRVGGLRPGEAMMLTERGVERLGPDARGTQCVEAGSAGGN